MRGKGVCIWKRASVAAKHIHTRHYRNADPEGKERYNIQSVCLDTHVCITEAPVRGGVGHPRGLTPASGGPGSARGRDSPGRVPARGRRSRPGVGPTHFGRAE